MIVVKFVFLFGMIKIRKEEIRRINVNPVFLCKDFKSKVFEKLKSLFLNKLITNLGIITKITEFKIIEAGDIDINTSNIICKCNLVLEITKLPIVNEIFNARIIQKCSNIGYFYVFPEDVSHCENVFFILSITKHNNHFNEGNVISVKTKSFQYINNTYQSEVLLNKK